jgi:hypothetical protein
MAVNTFLGTTDNNWGTATNWSQGTVPTATDGHVTTFDETSPNCTVDTSARVCQQLNFNGGTGYANTITMSNTITVSGSITLSAAMTIAGASNLEAIVTGTLTSNGKTWPNGLRLAGTSQTYTLADNWTVTGTLTTNGTTLTTINGAFNLNIGTNWIPSVVVNGTATVVMNGTGTLGSGNSIRLALTINTAGTITLSATIRFNGATFTYVAGTVVTTGSTFTTDTPSGAGVTTTLNLTGIVFNNVTLGSNAGTIVLSSDLSLTGTLILGSAGSATTVNGLFNINAAGSINLATASGVGGTCTVVVTGTGTYTNSGLLSTNFTINTTGTFTIASLTYGVRTLKYISGSVDGAKFLSIGSTAGCTIDTDGMTWGNVDAQNGGRNYILNSMLHVAGYIICGANSASPQTIQFSGVAGFKCRDFVLASFGTTQTFTLAAGVTYYITNFFQLSNVFAVITFNASGTGRVKLSISPGAIVSIYNVNFTNIDNASGYPIQVFGRSLPTLTTSGNWLSRTTVLPEPTNISQGLNQGLSYGLF